MVGGKLCKCCPCRQGRGKSLEIEENICGKENHDHQLFRTEGDNDKGKDIECEKSSDPPLLISLQTQLHDIEEIEEEQNGDDSSSSSTFFSKNSSIRKDHRGSEDSRQFQSSPSPTCSISNIYLIKGRRKKKIRFVVISMKLFSKGFSLSLSPPFCFNIFLFLNFLFLSLSLRKPFEKSFSHTKHHNVFFIRQIILKKVYLFPCSRNSRSVTSTSSETSVPAGTLVSTYAGGSGSGNVAKMQAEQGSIKELKSYQTNRYLRNRRHTLANVR